MSSKYGHKWYIEPLDAVTNEILAKNQEFLCEEEVFHAVKCEDGKPHSLWGCKDYSFVPTFCQSRLALPIKFKVWHQDGHGQIRPWIFAQKKKASFKELSKKMRVPKPVNEKP